MTASRFHHLTVCLLCIVACFLLAMHYRPSDWQFWLLMVPAIYAEQPLINETRPYVARLWPKRKRGDPYELVRPIAKQSDLL